jgi:hypothetical protein
VIFSTPYYHGDVRVSASLPVSMHVVKMREVVFAAQMGANTPELERESSFCEEDGWEGPVILPDSRCRKSGQRKLFVARLRGYTRRYPFLAGPDSVTIRPSPDSEVLQALRDSHFVAREWIVREDATHAKSKTYKRADILPGATYAGPAGGS